jgi:DNA-directed RNA polymerase subunit RPC12/RpoP
MEMSEEDVTLEFRCVRCGKKLGVYIGKVFFVFGLSADAKIVCEECYLKDLSIAKKERKA